MSDISVSGSFYRPRAIEQTFADHASHQVAILEARVHSDMLALLGDQVLPDEKLDVGIAVTVLDSILRLPGGQLNKTRLAAELGIDQRTVSRYLGILDRRFLLTFLPNLRTG